MKEDDATRHEESDSARDSEEDATVDIFDGSTSMRAEYMPDDRPFWNSVPLAVQVAYCLFRDGETFAGGDRYDALRDYFRKTCDAKTVEGRTIRARIRSSRLKHLDATYEMAALLLPFVDLPRLCAAREDCVAQRVGEDEVFIWDEGGPIGFIPLSLWGEVEYFRYGQRLRNATDLRLQRGKHLLLHGADPSEHLSPERIVEILDATF